MANFPTHIAIGTLVSGVAATLTVAANVIAPENLVAVTLAGVVGSVLPDIDLKDSRPSRALFSGLAVFFSFCVLFTAANKYSIAELWLLWLGTFVLVRYTGEYVFHRFSYHRGVWHSILAAVMFLLLTVVIFKNALGKPDGVAWLAGGFLFIGYLTHLILDEIYSVDVLDTRIKASFGTALKPFDAHHPADSVVVAVATIALFFMTPSPKQFVDGISSHEMWAGLRQKLLPHDKWFGVIGSASAVANAPPTSTHIATGSVAKARATDEATPRAP